MNKYIATFHTHYGAIVFQKFCERENIEAKMMPVPREISASCGVCVNYSAQYPCSENVHVDMEYCYYIAENGAFMQVES